MWLFLFVCLLILVVWRTYSAASIWKQKGIFCLKPFPIIGSYPLALFKRMPIIEQVRMTYNDLKDHDMAVYFSFTQPVIVLNDPDLIKEVFVKNFDHFVDRNTIPGMQKVHEESALMLTNLTGEEWKVMRASLSPAFTTGKLKNIVQAMNRTGPMFTKFINQRLEEKLSKGEEPCLEMKDLFGRYAMGVIAQAVYGIQADVFDSADPDHSGFSRNAKALQLQFSMKLILVFLVYLTMPSLAVALGLRFTAKEPFEFFKKIAMEVMEQKKKPGAVKSQDMLQLFMDLKEKANTEEDKETSSAQFESDAELKVEVDRKTILTTEAIVQSSVLFLLAGFDTTSSALSLATYYLATNPDVRQKAVEEVDALAAELESDEHLSYEDVGKLKYIEMVINETLRISPLATGLERMCTKDYTFSNGVSIKKGQQVQIHIVGLCNDPKYWSNPSEFLPERFDKEVRPSIPINPYVYTPFGSGPRNCIGMRFAMLEVKVALFHLLRSFHLEPSSKTPIPIKYDKKAIFTAIDGGNWVKLQPRNQ